MANKTSLIITSTDTGGKTFNKTVTDVNGNATADNLRAFAQGLNSLTTNTYNGAALVTRTEFPTDNTDAWFTVTPTTISVDSIASNGTTYGLFRYVGAGRVPTISGKKPNFTNITATKSGFAIEDISSGDFVYTGNATCTVTFTLPALGSYAAQSVDVTITGVREQDIVDIE